MDARLSESGIPFAVNPQRALENQSEAGALHRQIKIRRLSRAINFTENTFVKKDQELKPSRNSAPLPPLETKAIQLFKEP